MAICEWCSEEYEQSKWWQRFCCSSHKDDWHNHQKSLALRQREEEEAEVRREARLERPLSEILEKLKSKPDAGAEERGANGATSNYKPLSEILEAIPKPEPLPNPEQLFKRAWG